MSEADETPKSADVAGRLDGLVSHERTVRKHYVCKICKESIFVYALESWKIGPICCQQAVAKNRLSVPDKHEPKEKP